MADPIFEFVGWAGAALVLFAYFLITHRRVGAESGTYHFLNLFGGAGIMVNAFANNDLPPAGLNVVWVMIAIYGILQGAGLFRRANVKARKTR